MLGEHLPHDLADRTRRPDHRQSRGSRIVIFASIVRELVTYFKTAFVGKREDLLRRDADTGWKIARREILLEQSILLAKNLTTFF